MKNPKNNHVHKYKRFSFSNGRRAFGCVSCPSYVLEDVIVGHQAVCWRCGNVFTIDEKACKLAKPHCGCFKREENKTPMDADIDMFVKGLTKEQ